MLEKNQVLGLEDAPKVLKINIRAAYNSENTVHDINHSSFSTLGILSKEGRFSTLILRVHGSRG